jgi:hypothetical protein
MQTDINIAGLKERIKRTLIKERLVFFLGGLIGFIAGVVLISILLSVLAGIVILPVWAKIFLLAVSGLALLMLFWKICFSKLLGGTPESTALKLEKKFPALKGRLIAALQFSRFTVNDMKGFSRGLIGVTLKQADERSRNLDFNRIISAYPIWRNTKTILVAVLAVVGLMFIFPGLFSNSYNVYSNPTELIAPPLGYRLSAYPEDTVAVKYRDVDIGGIIQGDRFPEKAVIHYKFSGGTWQKTGINLLDMPTTVSAFGDSLYFYTTLRQVRRSFEFYIKAGRITTPVSRIEVVDRPRVTGLKLSLFYPPYTGLAPSVIDENDGTITAVVGTSVTMKIETNLPARMAQMVFADSSRSPFEIDGLTAEQSFRIDKDRRYYIHLLDYQGEVNPNPIEYLITAVPDEYPVIDVIRPGVDINLNEEMIVPLLLRISDDFGFSSLVLKYSHVRDGYRGEENVAVLHFSDNVKTEGEIKFNWDVEPLSMMPSDYLIYNFELADNDLISGPKVTASREYIARMPSLDEIIAQTDREQSENINRAEKYLKQHKDLAERIKNVVREIEKDRARADKHLTWQQQKELEDILTNEQKITEELKETAQQIDKMIDQMQTNDLTSREILEKLTEVQKLFEEVATPQMKEARLKLMEALKQMDPKELEKALEDFQMSQEELMERLNRTIALLKKMQIEQKITEMSELARRLAEEQEKVNESTSKEANEKLPSLAGEEAKVKSGLDHLLAEAEKLRELLKEFPFSKSEEAEKFCQSVEATDAGQNMDNMMSSLENSARDQAMEEGKLALSKLLELSDKLQQGQASMCGGNDGDIAKMMRQAINDIDYLSSRQESLMDKADDMPGSSEVLRDLAAEEQILKESLAGLAARVRAIGMESPFVGAELEGLVREAINNTESAINQLGGRRRLEAMGYQNEALYSLNRAAVRMLDALDSQNQCNRGSSCNKPSQSLSALSQRQKEVNQQTQSQCNNPGQLGQDGQDLFRRLAAEQNAIGKSMADLQNEFGNSREVLGRLDAIREDMEKIAEALSSGEVGQETLERQLKVYSRMLDAARTMQRKDFTDQRKAAIGEDIIRNSPAALSGNHFRGGLDIEDRLRKFLEENFPPEYEAHIKAYFKTLLENRGDYQIRLDNE